MDKILAIVRRKNRFFLNVSLIYIALLVILKWNIHPVLNVLWFATGGVIGIFFLDIADEFVHLQPSPFKSILFSAGLVVVAIFVVTSSGSLLASGLVLTIYLTLLLRQIGEWRKYHTLSQWYQMLASPVSEKVQYQILNVFVVLFFVVTYLFIRS